MATTAMTKNRQPMASQSGAFRTRSSGAGALAGPDYLSDMDDLGAQAATVVQSLKKDLDRTKRERDLMIAAMVLAAGGRIEVKDHHRITAYDLEMTADQNVANKSTVFTVKPNQSN